MTRHTPLVTAFSLALTTAVVLILVSWRAFHGGFYLDSEGFLRWLPQLENTPFSWQRIHDLVVAHPFPGATRRYLANLTFVLESYFLGVTAHTARLINLVLHSLNVGLLFLLSRRVLLRLGTQVGRARSAALLAALLWGFNPFHVDTVLYAVQRMTLLTTTFYFLGSILFLRSRETSGVRRWVLWTGLLVCYAAGLACKESMLLFPLGLFLLEWLTHVSPSGVEPRGGLRRNLLLIGGAASVLIVSALALGFDPASVWGSISNTRGREFTPIERLLTEGRVLLHYLTLFFLPLPNRPTFVLKYRLSRSLIEPISTLLSWVTILGLLVAGFMMRRKRPLFALAIFWFFGNHLLESTILSLEMAFIHRNYLPTAFLLLPAATWLVAHDEKRFRYFIRTGTALLLISFLVVWSGRAAVWGSPEAFWSEGAEKSPGSLRSYINLGVLKDIQGAPQEALEIYRRGEVSAFEETPASWSSLYCCMGIAQMNQQRWVEAKSNFDRAIALASLPDCLLNYAKLELALESPDRALVHLDNLAEIRPQHRKLHLFRARALIAKNLLSAAQQELYEELRLYPSRREAQQLLLELEQFMGKDASSAN